MNRFILAVLLASSILSATPIRAEQVNWYKMAASSGDVYDWSPGFWWGNSTPTAGDDVGFRLSYPEGTTAANVIATTVNYNVPTPIPFNIVTVSNLDATPITLSINPGKEFTADTVRMDYHGTLALYGGILTARVEQINSGGYVLQTDGISNSDDLNIFYGTYHLAGGTNNVIHALNLDNGEFLQSGGYNLPRILIVGDTDNRIGTYSLGGGSLVAVTESVGKSGAGVFNQTGGTNDVSGALTIGSDAYGLYDLSGGTLGAGYVTVGQSALGVFNQSGGTNTSRSVVIGDSGSSSGSSYYLSDGTLRAGSFTVGDSGAGIFGHTGGTSRIDELTLGWTANGSGTYTLNGSGSAGFTSLTAGIENIGFSGTGVFHQISSNDGVHNVGELNLGYNASGNGTYNMSGHVLLAAGDLVVGLAGTGTFTQNRGTNRIGAVILEPGDAPIGSGMLTLGAEAGGSGGYSMNPFDAALPELWASTEIIGSRGTGTFTQFGGTNTVAGDLYLGRYAGGIGTYTLSGYPDTYFNPFGTSPPATVLLAANEQVGSGGTGFFDQTGGTNRVTGDLRVGGTGEGTYTLTGGTLYATNQWIGAGTGTGTFLQSGGSNNVTNILTIGANGTYTLSGAEGPGSPASLITGGIINNGTFNYSGGSLSIYRPPSGPPPYPPDPDFTNNGTLNISGTGERYFSSLVINNGTVKTTNTTVIFNGNFINNGAYISDPSINIFRNLTVGETGYLVGATDYLVGTLGDVFKINGDLVVRSLRNDLWNTSGALLEFSSGIHTLDLLGSTVDFHFGTLQLDDGGYFSIASNGTIFADVLNIYDFSRFLTESGENEIHLNYGSLFAFNADGTPYDLTGEQLTRFASLGFIQDSGTQAPVPEPSTMLLLGSGLVGLAGYGRRKFRKR